MADTWQPIVAGVDGSPESVRAAAFAAELAARTRTTCHLVHAAADYWSSGPLPEVGLDQRTLDDASVTHARTLLEDALAGQVPDDLTRQLEVRVGRASLVIAEAATRVGAGLVVLGGKHHRALARIGSSTVTHMVRLGRFPVLAHHGLPRPISRIVAAVDLSYAARPTIAVAERFAQVLGAELRIMHAVEPMPVIPGIRIPVADEEVYRSASRVFESEIRPIARYSRAETVIRRGRAAAAIVREVEQWYADLVVVGSHGKGWVDRLLLGSVSERLLQLLPAPVLVVPVTQPDGARRQLLSAEPLPWEAEVRA